MRPEICTTASRHQHQRPRHFPSASLGTCFGYFLGDKKVPRVAQYYMRKGKIIVIDGTDGSGKATQTAMLARRLKREGRTVRTISFPRHGHPSGWLCDQYLAGKFGTAREVGPYRGSMFYAVDRFAASFEIRQWLAAGHVVIIDRWVSANMGHQASKISNSRERWKFLTWVQNLEYGLFNLPKPNVVLLLYMPPEVSRALVRKRGKKQDIHEKDKRHIQQAARVYLELAKRYRWPTIRCAEGAQPLPIADIHAKVWAKVRNLVR